VAISARTGALVAAVLGSTVVSVDSTVVNVALPRIADDLGGGLAGQQWIANAYLLALASLILIAGSLADLLGERRLFVVGVGGFGVTSLLCAVAPGVGALIAARALQGVFGAMLTPAALAIIVAVFPKEERGAAVGTWTAWGGIGILIGPLVGGQIVDALSWRFVFLLNLPLAAATLALAARYVPGPARVEGPRPRIDVLGAVLCALGLAGISFGLIEQPVHGLRSALVLAPLGSGAIVFAAFVAFEARTAAPMLPLRLFRRRAFAVANVETFAMYGGMAIIGFFLTLFLQQVAGYSALKAGSTGLVPTVVVFALSRRFGALADRRGPRALLATGPVVVAAGFLLLLRLDARTSYVGDLLPALVVFGLGLAITVAPLTATVLADADEHEAGIASAVNNAVARTAGLLVTAAVGAVLAASYAARVDDALSDRPLTPAGHAVAQDAKRRALAAVDPAALPSSDRQAVLRATSGASVATFHLAAGIGAGLLAAAGVIGGVLLRSPRRRTKAATCSGGQIVGVPAETALRPEPAT
jgi:EmrB/QacA subfamily drug resistance transporter